MTITQTVDIPDSYRLTIDVPREVPTGKTIISFTPVTSSPPKKDPRTVEEALQMAKEQAANPNRKPISSYFGIISPDTYGDGVAYQRKLREEWDG